jgi:hypothetical protein
MYINQSMSLYIPHVFPTIGKRFIANLFMKLDLGKVSRIDFVAKYNYNTDEHYNNVYIHFEYWFENRSVQRFQESIQNRVKTTKLVYDDPWYWIVLENQTEKRMGGYRQERLELMYTTPEHGKSQVFYGAPKRPQRRERLNINNPQEICRRLDFENLEEGEINTTIPFPSMDL